MTDLGIILGLVAAAALAFLGYNMRRRHPVNLPKPIPYPTPRPPTAEAEHVAEVTSDADLELDAVAELTDTNGDAGAAVGNLADAVNARSRS